MFLRGVFQQADGFRVHDSIATRRVTADTVIHSKAACADAALALSFDTILEFVG